MKKIIAVFIVCALSGCAAEKKDYDVEARCQKMGYQTDTPEYEQCVSDEKMARLMEQQRQEYEQMKRDERDWKLRQY